MLPSIEQQLLPQEILPTIELEPLPIAVAS